MAHLQDNLSSQIGSEMNKVKKGYGLFEEESGAAMILILVIVSVLFILTSFLVRKVVVNTTMVEKTGKEQESYALAKQGIIYALERLNAWEGISPNYDSTDWLNGENWEEENWNPFDLNGDGKNDVQLRIDKDDIPHPQDNDPPFDSEPEGDDNGDRPYITIESRDFAKKLVTLQAIAKNNSPLLNYVRFVNSDTILKNNTFDEDDSTSLIQGDAPFCVLGNVTWKSGSSNDLRLSGDNKAIIYGNISNGGVSSLRINGSNANSDHSYFFNPDDAPYDDPALFDTAEGHYFSSTHLPSCYDYSSGTPTFHYGSTQIISWPEINKDRYENLASGINCYLNNPDEINMESEWSDYNNDNNPSYDNDTTDDEWFQDVTGVSTSYHYYPHAARLVLNTANISQELSNGTVNTIDYSAITNNIIYAEGDLSVSGIIPAGRQLTIVSGGNIFIDSNLLKEANSASLALLAKKNIVLNPTLRYGMDSGNTSSNPLWYDPDASLGNPDGNYTSPTESVLTPFEPDETKTYTLDIDLGRAITGGRLVLWNYQNAGGGLLETKLQVLVTSDDSPPADSGSWEKEVFPLEDVPTSDHYHIDFIPCTFRWIRLNLEAHNKHTSQSQDFNLSVERFDAIEIPIYGIDAALCTEGGGLKVVTGGGVDQEGTILPNNDAYKPLDTGGLKTPSDSGPTERRLFFWGTLAETEWTGSISGWQYIAYAYDDNLSSNPPPSFPPSVNLVSLRRK